jgi:transcriptional regulator with XRE-family HTH domain
MSLSRVNHSPDSGSTVGPTLAQAVQQLREARDLTQRGLAQRALLPVDLIADLEAGLETFMAPAIRLKLARALRVRPVVLEALERLPSSSLATPMGSVPKPGSEAAIQFLQQVLEAHMADAARPVLCPACGSRLEVQVRLRRDLQNNPVHALRVHCLACLFHLSHG